MKSATHPAVAAASGLVANFGSAAHQAIGVYRAGAEHLVHALEHPWKLGLKQTSPRLRPETHHNAARAQEAFSAWYASSLLIPADSAKVVINALVGAAIDAIAGTAVLAQQHTRKAA